MTNLSLPYVPSGASSQSSSGTRTSSAPLPAIAAAAAEAGSECASWFGDGLEFGDEGWVSNVGVAAAERLGCVAVTSEHVIKIMHALGKVPPEKGGLLSRDGHIRGPPVPT